MPPLWRAAGPADQGAVLALMLDFYEESGVD